MPNEFNFVDIGQRILNKRKEQRLTQTQLAKKGGFDPATINQLEQGKQAVSEKYLIRLTKVLGISLEFLLYGADTFNIGFGFSHTSSPIFLLLNEHQIPNGFEFTYHFKKGLKQPDFYSNDKPYPDYNDDKDKLEYFSAPWLVDAVSKGIIDMAFVPYGTYKFKVDHIMKFCSIMNTAKGGLLALICTNDNELLKIQPGQEKVIISDVIKRLKEKNEIKVTFLKNTIAEDFFNNTFLTPEFNKVFIPDPHESKNLLPDLIKKISDNLVDHAQIESSECSVFVGWEPHVTKVKNMVEQGEVKCIVADQSDFDSPEDPFFHITLDCIIKSERLQEYKNNNQIKQFLLAIKEAVQTLNELKNYRGAHYKIRELADRLLMKDDAEETYQALHKINFEFSTDII